MAQVFPLLTEEKLLQSLRFSGGQARYPFYAEPWLLRASLCVACACFACGCQLAAVGLCLQAAHVQSQQARRAPCSTSDRLKKAVAVSGEKSRSIPEGGGRFSRSHFPCRKVPNLGSDSISCCRKFGEAVPNLPEKPFQQGTDSHSLLEFSERNPPSSFPPWRENRRLNFIQHRCGVWE